MDLGRTETPGTSVLVHQDQRSVAEPREKEAEIGGKRHKPRTPGAPQAVSQGRTVPRNSRGSMALLTFDLGHLPSRIVKE